MFGHDLLLTSLDIMPTERAMNEQSVLKKVAKMAKISDRYISAWGNEAYVKDETIEQLLSALGYDTTDDQTLLKSAQKRHKTEILAPVKVIKDPQQPIEIELNLGLTVRESEFSWQVITENGEVLEGYLQSQVIKDERSNGGALIFQLPKLPLGYHQLTVTRKRRKNPYQMTIIITPESCYKQSSLLKGEKLWGPSIQLYTVRTAYNWGIGDFGDLKQLITEVASRGGDFIGLNPIHALFPANPEGASPYSPSSRHWLNIMYIDVTAIPEFVLSSAAQQKVGCIKFQQRLKSVRKDEWVNYSEVAALKLSVLPLLFKEFEIRHLSKETERAEAFHDFVAQGGESLQHQAAFDALHAHLHQQDPSVWGCPVFPNKYSKFSNIEVHQFITQNRSLVESYLYYQWIADTQINEAQQFAEECGMSVGLYRDLAVGEANSGSASWADNGHLVLDASIGAPPDVFGPLGQNWGLPPLNPQVLKNSGYAPFIALLRANMKHCGALRIDHVLGLLRLWWVPKNKTAAEGAYIYYPVEDLLAILALESHRHQCAVIGEDLGTVPDEIVDILASSGIHSYKLFFFEVAEDGGFFSPTHYTEQSMSALCTHDMPTLRGFWHCEDLRMGKELGLYPDPVQLKALYDERLRSKQEILNSLAWHGLLPEGVGKDAAFVPMDSYLSEALHLHLAAGSSALFSVQLEDLLEMDMPVNIPGTVNEYPNWRRKLSVNIDDIFQKKSVNRLAKQMTQLRLKASH